MKKVHGLLVILAIILTASSCEDKYSDIDDGIYAEIETTKGTMLAQLYYEATPVTVANFVALAEGNHEYVLDSLKGKAYYDGLIFHRVIDSFMIQGGDYSGTGAGQVGYQFEQEIVDSLKHDEKGVLSMANAGPDTNGSQFFIMDEPNPNLDGGYNVFGKVDGRIAVIDSISMVKTNPRDNRPMDSVVMKKVTIIRKGKDAKKWDAVKTFKDAQEMVAERKAKEEKLAEERRAAAPAYRQEKAAMFADVKSKATTIAGGVKIYTVKKGNGEKPAAGSQVQLDYAGYFENGNLFDTSDVDKSKRFDPSTLKRKSASL